MKSIFNFSLRRKKNQHFILHDYLDFDTISECKSFLRRHIVDEETAKSEYRNCYCQIIYNESGDFESSNFYMDGELFEENCLKGAWPELKYENIPTVDLIMFIKNQYGPNQIGGTKPNNFQIPNEQENVPFQYVGTISNKDPNFSWLPFDLHLTLPMFHNLVSANIDYSDSMKPKVIDLEISCEYKDEIKELSASSDFIFTKIPFTTKITKTEFSSLGMSGVPGWLQGQNYVTSPKSKKPMKFICEISENWGVDNPEELAFVTIGGGHKFNLLTFTPALLLFFIDLENRILSIFHQDT